MSAVLEIEEGAIETRAALVDEGRVRRLWFGPAPYAAPQDLSPRYGERFIGRLKSVDSTLGAAFVDIGCDQAGFLAVKPSFSNELAEGGLIEVEVRAPSRQAKGAQLNYLGPAGAGAEPGRSGPMISPASAAVAAIGKAAARIVVDTPRLRAELEAEGVEGRLIETNRSTSASGPREMDEAIDEAFARRVALPGGAGLVIDETEALVAIDVDTGVMTASSSDRLREKTIGAAAAECVRQIELRNLAGRIVVDFPSVKSRAVRERAAADIERRFGVLERVSSLSLSRGNFLVLTKERRGPTLLEAWTEPAMIEPVPGRRFTIEWTARCAMRACERRQRARASARLEIQAGALLFNQLKEVVGAGEKYFDRFGVALGIAQSNNHDPRSFEVIEQ